MPVLAARCKSIRLLTLEILGEHDKLANDGVILKTIT